MIIIIAQITHDQSHMINIYKISKKLVQNMCHKQYFKRIKIFLENYMIKKLQNICWT